MALLNIAAVKILAKKTAIIAAFYYDMSASYILIFLRIATESILGADSLILIFLPVRITSK